MDADNSHLFSDAHDVLDQARVTAILDAAQVRDVQALNALLDGLHPADVADALEQISDSARNTVLELWRGSIDGDVLSELDYSIREDVIDSLEPKQLADALRDMESDDVVDLVEDLDEPQQEVVLGALDKTDRAVVEQSLAFPEKSAGRLMQREVVMAPQHWDVGQSIDYLRNSTDLPEQFYHLIMVDARARPVGYVTLGRLLGSARGTLLSDIAEDSFQTISVDTTEEDVAYIFNQYHLISAPVVDEDERLIGMITIDDAMVVLDEGHEEDILRLAGVGENSLSDRVFETTKHRMPWLAVNLCTAILASLVIAQFDMILSQIVALAVLMPIVASMGGNAGTQSLTVAVRALATKDLTTSNLWRVVRREVLVGFVNGILFSVVLAVIGYIWFQSITLSLILAAAMVINLVVAGLAGIMVPILLARYKIDPALASGAFVTTVTDVVGFWAFLGLAAWALL